MFKLGDRVHLHGQNVAGVIVLINLADRIAIVKMDEAVGWRQDLDSGYTSDRADLWCIDLEEKLTLKNLAKLYGENDVYNS